MNQRPTHFEILAEDPIAMAEFYQQTLGWKINLWGAEEQRYWLIETGEGPGINGGMMQRHFPQAVINTVDVDAIDPLIEKVIANGGKVVHGPHDIPEVGRHVYCADPEGTIFGLIEQHKR